MDEKIIIYADNREAGSRIIDILKKRCTVEERNLEVGDYLLSRRVVVERKTAQDFLSSMTDGRLFRQISEMRNNFKSPVIIVEGETLFQDKRDIHPNAIRGALAAIAVDFSLPMLWTRNQLETAEMLLSIAKREQDGKKRKNAVRGRKKARSMNEAQEFLISGLPSISREKAKSLLKKFGTPERIFAATEDELRSADGVGEKLAKIIRKIATKKYEKSILED